MTSEDFLKEKILENRKRFKDTVFKIENQSYIALIDFDTHNLQKGDLVFDMKDQTYGRIAHQPITSIHETAQHQQSFTGVTVGEGIAAEVGVDVNRLIKLENILSKKLQESNQETGIFE